MLNSCLFHKQLYIHWLMQQSCRKYVYAVKKGITICIYAQKGVVILEFPNFSVTIDTLIVTNFCESDIQGIKVNIL